MIRRVCVIAHRSGAFDLASAVRADDVLLALLSRHRRSIDGAESADQKPHVN